MKPALNCGGCANLCRYTSFVDIVGCKATGYVVPHHVDYGTGVVKLWRIPEVCPRPASEVQIRPEEHTPPEHTWTVTNLADIPAVKPDDVQDLLRFLSRQRLKTSDEKTAQADLADLLEDAGYEFEREKRLSDKDIPDFVVKLGAQLVVIELKIKAQRKSIYRQLERYAQHDDISALILYTATAMHLPEKINEKPAFVASMGAGWL